MKIKVIFKHAGTRKDLIGRIYRFHNNKRTWKYTGIYGDIAHYIFLTRADGSKIDRDYGYAQLKNELKAIEEGFYIRIS